MPLAFADLCRHAFSSNRVLTSAGSLVFSDVTSVLKSLGPLEIEPREAMGICFNNGAKCLSTYAALAERNIVAVPLPPGLSEAERVRLWTNLGCRFALDEAKGALSLTSTGEPILWPNDIYWVMHSSGSTGIPKAIPITLTAMRRNAQEFMSLLGIGTDLLHLGSMSQCYTSGLYNSFLLPLLTGGRVLTGPIASALKVDSLIEVIRMRRPDILWVNPAVLSFLVRRANDADLESVKVMISCTAPLSNQECIEAEDHFRRPVLQSYGLTETLIVSLELPGRDSRKEFSAGAIVGGSKAVTINPLDGVLEICNGAVTPGYAVKKDGRLGFELPSGAPGERFRSGDVAELRDGRLTITGRLTNVINTGGVKISPELMEDILSGCSGVEQAVVGKIVEPNGLERPVALIKASGIVETKVLGDICAQRLGPQARPVLIKVVNEIPRTANGKVDRTAAATLIEQLYEEIRRR